MIKVAGTFEFDDQGRIEFRFADGRSIEFTSLLGDESSRTVLMAVLGVGFMEVEKQFSAPGDTKTALDQKIEENQRQLDEFRREGQAAMDHLQSEP